jgi:hypothetical protein
MRSARLALLVVVVAACGGGSPSPQASPPLSTASTGSATQSLVGLVTLNNQNFVERSGEQRVSYGPNPPLAEMFPCSGTDQNSDLATGAQVTVTNESGTIVGATTLADDQDATAQVLASPGPNALLPLYATNCYFEFQLTSLPAAAFYTVKIGSRTGTTYPLQQLQQDGWAITLSF